MSIISKIGAAVGVGGADVTVTLERGEYTWNDEVRGTVRVQGGNVEQTASEVKVYVEEHYETQDSEGGTDHHYINHFETVLATNVTLAPGAAQEFPFALRVPDRAAPGHDWAVVGRFCVPRSKDQLGKAGFQARFPAALVAVEAALQRIALFQRKAGLIHKEDVEFDYRPPQELKQHLDGVRTLLRLEGDAVAGILEINPQEKSLGDVLKSLAKKDRVRHEIRFTAQELASPQVIEQRLRTLLQPYLG